MEGWIRRQLSERQLPLGRPRLMFQQWTDLLFLHWTFDPSTVQETLPAGLFVDTYEGLAWVGIVPFRMRRVRPVVLPLLSTGFLELNLRTYVKDRSEVPGVWFYSLDANQPLAVWTADFLFALPYRHSKMHAEFRNQQIRYFSQRHGSSIGLQYEFRAADDLGEAKIGSLEFFLIERYRLFAVRDRQLLTARVYHSPYQLRKAVVSKWDESLFQLDGLQAPVGPPSSTLCSTEVDVTVYPIEVSGRLESFR
jgi:uncharacterized protein